MKRYRILKTDGYGWSHYSIQRRRRFLFWTYWRTERDFERDNYKFSTLDEALEHLYRIEMPVRIEVLKEVCI